MDPFFPLEIIPFCIGTDGIYIDRDAFALTYSQNKSQNKLNLSHPDRVEGRQVGAEVPMKLKDKGGFPRRKLMENLKILKFFLCQIYNASLSDASNG